MQSQYIRHTKQLLADKQIKFLLSLASEPGKPSCLSLNIKLALNETIKKIVYLLLSVLFTNNISATDAGDINNISYLQFPSGSRQIAQAKMDYARYINVATALPAPASRTFDYDPSLLPEVAEVIFALRIKHANISKLFVINLSGNYLLELTKDKIKVLDTHTKNIDVYQYQSDNPNITIGLGVSKGLPRNYKSIIIKEDAHGKLYDYAALHIDNISTDETILSETLSHPFYQIAGEDGVENEVKVTKAMAFYHERPSHERHARCVKSSQGIFGQLQDILWGSGTGLCGPKAASGLRSANHKTVEDMKLETQLVEADVKSKYPDTVGFLLRLGLDFKDQNLLASLTASRHCNVTIMEMIGDRREKRALNSERCVRWTIRLIRLFMSLGLHFRNIYQIIRDVVTNNRIAARFFPNGNYPANSEEDIQALRQTISDHQTEAPEVIQEASAIAAQVAISDPNFRMNDEGASLTTREIRQSVANARLGCYTVFKYHFRPLVNSLTSSPP